MSGDPGNITARRPGGASVGAAGVQNRPRMAASGQVVSQNYREFRSLPYVS